MLGQRYALTAIGLLMRAVRYRIHRLTSSFSSFVAKAATDRAVDMSDSSKSFAASPYVFFQSSANGPAAASFGRTPTFFYEHVRDCSSCRQDHSYTGAFDQVQASLELLCVLFLILSTDQYFESDFAAFQSLQVFG